MRAREAFSPRPEYSQTTATSPSARPSAGARQVRVEDVVRPHKKKTLQTVLIAVGITGAIVGIYYLVRYLVNLGTNEENVHEDKTTGEIINTSTGEIIPTETASFPMEKGMRGTVVTALQKALIKMGFPISGAPSQYFGNNTYAALKKAGYDTPLSRSDYENILAGKTKTFVAADQFKSGEYVKIAFPSSVYADANGRQFLGSVNPQNIQYIAYYGKYSKIGAVNYYAGVPKKLIINTKPVFIETANLRK